MAKKLLIILGAGSSISCNMPSVDTLDGWMRTWSQRWAASHGFPDYFEALWQAVENYYGTASPGLRPPLNFEKVLGEMISLSHWMTPAPWGNTLRQAACEGAVPPHLVFPFPEKYGPAVTVRDQLCHLLIELAKHMRTLCQTLGLATDSARKYTALLDGLRGAFDVGVYNLNYDTIALTAWPYAYTGFGATGGFEATSIHQRQDWGFIYHLHGSVHHSLVGLLVTGSNGDRIWQARSMTAIRDGQPMIDPMANRFRRRH
jgi:hypothetical protein